MTTQSAQQIPVAVEALSVPVRATVSNYPAPFLPRVAGRRKRVLGDLFGLRNFGVNLTRLGPGDSSSLHHRHGRQDEFIYVLEGEPVLVTDTGEVQLRPGHCAGFPAGGTAHHLENRGSGEVLYLEIGDRSADDPVEYPLDDLALVPDPATGRRRYAHKDGRPW
ncbi:cupin domain-containing protein [Belnapia sp. T6]|uniref:Cupin domain-containing protein n=1 Tax=Belnapia mucosa TaxID=2804532 RepID=A0ABS1V1D0_9PROT|nr:cupin domain-containing protein [Belnapia mucosa]MBL6455480.1 cupin domain-containing protein [Belnapia mucosa]